MLALALPLPFRITLLGRDRDADDEGVKGCAADERLRCCDCGCCDCACLPLIEDALAVRDRGPDRVEFSLSSPLATANDCLLEDDTELLLLLLLALLLLLLASLIRASSVSRKVSLSCDGINPLLGDGKCSVAISEAWTVLL